MHALKPSGAVLFRLIISMIVITFCAVGLRFAAKIKIRAEFALEDWLIVLALLLYFIYVGAFLEAILKPSSPGSLEPSDFTLPQINTFLKNVWITELIMTLQITVVKISILRFYWTIFSNRSFRRVATVFIGICVSWLVIMTFVLIFQCKPVYFVFDYEKYFSADCIPIGRLLFGYELSNLLLDISILCLPVYMIRRLQLSSQKKIFVSGVFLLGAFVCVTCIVRMWYVYNADQPTILRSIPSTFYWTIIELGFAIICACLPLYAPIFSGATALPKRVRSRYNSLWGSIARKSQDYTNKTAEGDLHPSRMGEGLDTTRLTRHPSSNAEYEDSYPMEHFVTRNAKSAVEVV